MKVQAAACSPSMLLGALLCLSCGCTTEYKPQNGDIIFHTSRSAQSLAVQRATASPYSHMGIVYVKNGNPFVFEAVGPVKLTSLNEWTQRGEGERFVVKRLADADRVLTPDAIARMIEVGTTLEGRPYDLLFEWSDERLYCSELVWKVFKRALQVEVGHLQTISEFDLSDPVVQAKIRERWGDQLPMDELVVSPATIFDSDRLVTVYERR
ncbi:YiiX family permuted papain-like enzyme [Candidatus Eisenbacteria bacterium]|uniref:YiiX family permuted papain-like enzyme n=1 Tax=Eiseniibacteriota bacterium TaxID=2212470 RepID=A0ABV6YJ13_UNCEI